METTNTTVKVISIDEKNQQLLEFVKTLRYNQRIVFSDEGNLDSPKDIEEEYQSSEARAKPRGLWYSQGRAWVSYLHDANLTWARKRLGIITHVHQLYPNWTRVLRIRNVYDFDRFTRGFSVSNGGRIRWKAVARCWDGIDIRFIEARCRSGWYEHWDVSGGCIWRPSSLRAHEGHVEFGVEHKDIASKGVADGLCVLATVI